MTAALKEKVPYCTVLYRTVLYYTVLYCTTKLENLLTENKQTDREQTDSSKTEATLILCGSSGERANIKYSRDLRCSAKHEGRKDYMCYGNITNAHLWTLDLHTCTLHYG